MVIPVPLDTDVMFVAPLLYGKLVILTIFLTLDDSFGPPVSSVLADGNVINTYGGLLLFTPIVLKNLKVF